MAPWEAILRTWKSVVGRGRPGHFTIGLYNFRDPFETTHEMSSLLAGGFNPSEKYKSNWIISPGRDENTKYLKTTPRLALSFASTNLFLSKRFVIKLLVHIPDNGV